MRAQLVPMEVPMLEDEELLVARVFLLREVCEVPWLRLKLVPEE